MSCLDIEVELFVGEFKNDHALADWSCLLHFFHLTVAFFLLDALWLRDNL